MLPKNSIKVNSLKKNNPLWDMKKIINKTGINKIWFTKNDQTAMDLGIGAAKKVLKKFNKNSIDTLLYVTQSPEYFLPSTSCIIQNKLGLNSNIKSFDINLGCSGFVYALFTAASFIESKMSKNVLIICSDTYTKFINKSDRTCKPLFSDAASSILVSRSKEKNIGPFLMGTDGSGYSDLIVKEGAGNNNFKSKSKNELFMNGSRIFSFTISQIPKNIKKLFRVAKIEENQIKKYFFHQGSKLILNTLGNALKIDSKKIFSNLVNLGNTVSSTIPFALKEANKKKIVKNNDILILSGFGVGLSWGSCVIKWKKLN